MEIIILDHQSSEIENIIKKLNKIIKSDDNDSGTYLPKKLNSDNFLILLKNKNLDKIVSFIWYGFYLNSELGKILHINFSYTFNKFRNNGYNKLLRLKLEKICISENIAYITSVPFENSPSKKILINLGYDSKLNYFYKKINLIN